MVLIFLKPTPTTPTPTTGELLVSVPSKSFWVPTGPTGLDSVSDNVIVRAVATPAKLNVSVPSPPSTTPDRLPPLNAKVSLPPAPDKFSNELNVMPLAVLPEFDPVTLNVVPPLTATNVS